MSKHLIVVCCCVVGLYAGSGCKKTKSAPVAQAAAVTFPAVAGLPYDTTHADGIFSARILLDTATTRRECSLGFTAWFTQRVSNILIDSAVIIGNGRTLAGAGRYRTAAVNTFSPPARYIPDTSVAWTMSGNASYSFAYANSDAFPSCSLALPDTITAANSTFLFTAANTTGADTVMLQLQVPLAAGSTTSLIYYAGTSSGSIVLDSSVVSSMAGKQVSVFVSVFNHSMLTIKGYRYIFIKEYTRGKNIWFK